MRNNSTWGTDVEMFAVALLLQTDIWIFSADMGNKWMLFSGKGAKLIDALESPPVNASGSIYLNHNGVHYEPILGIAGATSLGAGGVHFFWLFLRKGCKSLSCPDLT